LVILFYVSFKNSGKYFYIFRFFFNSEETSPPRLASKVFISLVYYLQSKFTNNIFYFIYFRVKLFWFQSPKGFLAEIFGSDVGWSASTILFPSQLFDSCRHIPLLPMSVPFRLDDIIFAGHARSNDRYVVLLVAYMLRSHAARIARFEFFTFGIAQDY